MDGSTQQQQVALAMGASRLGANEAPKYVAP